MPRISVIIPTYNCAAYLPDAIDSVLGQSYQDFEIIVVNDGSTDNTTEVLDKYRSTSSVKYIYQENRGPGAARNSGLTQAKGKYICFLDSDDELTVDSLKVRHDALDSDEQLMMVFADYGLRNADGSYIERNLKHHNFLEYFKDSFLCRHNDVIAFNDKFIELFYSFSPHPIWTGTVMIKKAAVESVGYFRTDISVGEDTDYWTRMAAQHKIGYIDLPTAVYNHVRSYLTKDMERYCLDRIRSLKSTAKPTYFQKRIIHANISDTYFQLGYYHFHEKNERRLAIKYFLAGLTYNYRNRDCIKSLMLSFVPHYVINKIKLLRSSRSRPRRHAS